MLSYSLSSVISLVLLLTTSGVLGFSHHHYAPIYQKRQEQAPTTYTLFTPSPGASPIPVTKQGQVLTTFVPQYTLCPSTVGPALTSGRASMSVSAVLHTPLTSSARPSSGRFMPRPANGTGMYPMRSTPASPTLDRRVAAQDSCSTAYQPELTTICATTLQGIGSAITVTDCDQTIVFSTEVSFNVVVPSDFCEPSRVAQLQPAATTTTLYLAHWDALTDGQIPSDVTTRICSGGDCAAAQETSSTSRITRTSTSTTTIFTTVTIYPSSKALQETAQTRDSTSSGMLVAAQLTEDTTTSVPTAAPSHMNAHTTSISTTHVRSTVTTIVTLYPVSTTSGSSVLATLASMSSSSDGSLLHPLASSSTPSSSPCASALSSLSSYIPPSR